MRFKFIIALIFFANICLNSNGAPPHRDSAKGKAIVEETEVSSRINLFRYLRYSQMFNKSNIVNSVSHRVTLKFIFQK